ncbi:hypothetical protein AQUCO_06900007v1 [Aquilegia coerulea]|uniref:Uncharacterized protein n=1 Tax=Aquilegia coerulea TaxID=218851 RepID=A0A2G5CAY3_AQUCA|nr:hypothetical protein AQUCO_06900007v1 [Aquilegia coerulea]
MKRVALGKVVCGEHNQNHCIQFGVHTVDGCQQFKTNLFNPGGIYCETWRNEKKYKYTADQKEKMTIFAEKIGWQISKAKGLDEVQQFCNNIGVPMKKFKVCLNNQKRTLRVPE